MGQLRSWSGWAVVTTLFVVSLAGLIAILLFEVVSAEKGARFFETMLRVTAPPAVALPIWAAALARWMGASWLGSLLAAAFMLIAIDAAFVFYLAMLFL